MRKLKKLFPPGYEYRAELKIGGLLWGGTVCISGLYFFPNLHRAINHLFQYELYVGYKGEPPGRVRMEAFEELVEWYWALWLPVIFFWAAMLLCHYLYYYRDTRSIYVMRRIPRRGAIFRSCVPGSVLGAGITLVTAVLLYLLYHQIYWLCITAEWVHRFR